MKTTSLLAQTFVATAFIGLGPVVSAQAPSLQPTPAAPPPVTLAPSAEPRALLETTAAPAKKLSSFKTPPDELKNIVDALQSALLDQKLDPINVLVAPEVESLKVPALDLRNVAGSEALSLIASAASCDIEAIRAPAESNNSGPSRHQQIVGYKLRGSGKFGGSSLALALPAISTPAPQAAPEPIVNSNTILPAPVPGSALSTAVVGFGAPSANFAGGTSADPIDTRVYPIAKIANASSFPEVEKTLEEVLATSEVPKSQVKLAFHEKTNVLVVRGPAEVQAIVEQFLRALEKNTALSNEREAAQTLVPLQLKLESLNDELARLRKQLGSVEEERRELEKQNNRLQDLVPKK